LLALTLALVGQRLFEPPTRAAWTGIAFYIAAAGLLIWACLRGEWTLSGLPESQSRTEKWFLGGNICRREVFQVERIHEQTSHL
jgi:hypothetical protein